MGIYRKYIFPRIVNYLLGGEDISAHRRALLENLRGGKVLEVGFGTGLNLPHYPESVKKLSIVDPNPGMHALAIRRMMKSPIKIDGHVLKGEKLPFKDESYDAVVSTYTLCSIPEVGKALLEMRRVLKKGGRFYFLEHGLSKDPEVQVWQNRLNPLEKWLGDGCHLNRKIDWLIEAAGFKILKQKKFYHDKLPRFVGFFYLGTAEK